jgi:hypothetical protein
MFVLCAFSTTECALTLRFCAQAVAYLAPLFLFGHYVIETLFLVIMLSNFDLEGDDAHDLDDGEFGTGLNGTLQVK